MKNRNLSKVSVIVFLFVAILVSGCSKYYGVKKSSVLIEEGVTSLNFPKNSLHELDSAFEKDGYKIVELTTFQGKRGMKAISKTANNYESKKKKAIYYVEGTGYQMGFLLGRLAYDKIHLMTDDFLNGIIPAFLNPGMSKKSKNIFWEMFMNDIKRNDKKMSKEIPQELLDEMKGIVDGCKKANPNSKVTFDDIFTLNVGIDYILSIVYNVEGLWKRVPGIEVHPLRMPILCNAFSVFGNATVDGKHYYGRDFMFPTEDVFQKTACMIIYNPDSQKNEKKRLPMVAVTAPGFVGSITAMNSDGIAAGVDMVVGANVNFKNPGFNSLLLVRHVGHNATSADSAVKIIENANRGVTWLYSIADGKNDEAVIVEAGMKPEVEIDPLDYPSDYLFKKNLLPDSAFIEKNLKSKISAGLVARWHNFEYPDTFLTFNKKLFANFDKPYRDSMFAVTGFIDSSHTAKALPHSYYFAPQRENKDDCVLSTNNFVAPQMRFFAMNDWSEKVLSKHVDDSQWRYDALNKLLLTNYGNIDFDKARDIIDFLAPNGKYYPNFYQKTNKSDYFYQSIPSSDGKTMQIFGATSICDLTDQIIFSHFGYFKDEWIKVTLPDYVK